MKKNKIILFLILISSFHCYSQSTAEDIHTAKQFLRLDDEKFAVLIKNDSVIQEINHSIRVNDTIRLKRRVDSLIAKNYTLKEFFVMLEFDRLSPNITIEVDRRKNVENRIEIDSVGQLQQLIKVNRERIKTMKIDTNKTKN